VKRIFPAALGGVMAIAALVNPAHAQQAGTCGLQRGAVVEGRDPEGRDRLLILMPALGPQPVWAERTHPRKPFRAAPAAAGDLVFVLLETCDPAWPVVIGFVRP